jgi:hypothetical protein
MLPGDHVSSARGAFPDATIEEAALATSCLIALTGAGYQEAVQTLRAWPKEPLGVGATAA